MLWVMKLRFWHGKKVWKSAMMFGKLLVWFFEVESNSIQVLAPQWYRFAANIWKLTTQFFIFPPPGGSYESTYKNMGIQCWSYVNEVVLHPNGIFSWPGEVDVFTWRVLIQCCSNLKIRMLRWHRGESHESVLNFGSCSNFSSSKLWYQNL